MLSKNSGIYAIVNKVNGKIYVGQTCQERGFHGRKGVHWSNLKANRHKNKHLQSAWNMYGEDNFEFIILCECPVDELTKNEQKWMDRFPDDMKYNCGPAADAPNRGRKFGPLSAERRAAISECHKGNKYCLGHKHTEEFKEKVRKASTGRKHRAETKRKLSEIKKGKHPTEEHRRKISKTLTGRYGGEKNPFYGKKHDEKTREKMKQSHIGEKHPEKTLKAKGYRKTRWNSWMARLTIDGERKEWYFKTEEEAKAKVEEVKNLIRKEFNLL